MNTKDETQEIKRLSEIMAKGETDDAEPQDPLFEEGTAKDASREKVVKWLQRLIEQRYEK